MRSYAGRLQCPRANSGYHKHRVSGGASSIIHQRLYYSHDHPHGVSANFSMSPMTGSPDPTASPATTDPAATPRPIGSPLHRLGRAIGDAILEVFGPLLFLLRNRKHMRFFRAVGPSMRSALQPEDQVVVMRLADAPLERGAIVAFNDGWHADHEFSFKRVIALPGEEIEIRAHQVIVDGQALVEPYVIPPTHGTVLLQRLGPDECFVMGDNRCNSCDSRTHGPLPVDWIIGRAVYRSGPWSRAGALDASPPMPPVHD